MSCAIKRNAGVTIIEVLFAAGIAIFGLIGIASLIAVGGRQSLQSNEAVETQAMARAWYGEFVARGFNKASTWRWYQDLNPVASRFSTSFDNSFEPGTGTSAGGVRTKYRHAVCIDPAFFSHTITRAQIDGNTYPPNQAYRPGLFPYYQDNYDPLSYPVADLLPPAKLPAFYAGNHPRLLRLSLQVSTAYNPMPPQLVDQIFMSRDDLAKELNEVDRTLPTTRLFTPGGRALSGWKYSWFATLCPREYLPSETSALPPAFPGLPPNTDVSESYYTLSIVVLSQRDRIFELNGIPGPENVPQGERLLFVSPPSPPQPITPFTDGSGGRVKLSSSISTSDRMRIGDWVMLSKQLNPGAVVCRWYRIIGMDSETERDVVATDTWSRNVLLDGPDWSFDTNTQATLVSNVVTVLERVIPVEF